jgi:hypothetical protein
MGERHRYVRRPDQCVVAVRFAFDTDGFTYRKWGGDQRCKPGDWIVDNHGDTYTVDAESFARTYTAVGPGTYRKTAPVWAERATASGRVATKEGQTRYDAGDYVVFNEADGRDGYAVSAADFEKMYERADE